MHKLKKKKHTKCLNLIYRFISELQNQKKGEYKLIYFHLNYLTIRSSKTKKSVQ